MKKPVTCFAVQMDQNGRGGEGFWYLLMHGTNTFDPILSVDELWGDVWRILWYYDPPGASEIREEDLERIKALYEQFIADANLAKPKVVEACARHGIRCYISWDHVAWHITMLRNAGQKSEVLSIGIFETQFRASRKKCPFDILLKAAEWAPSLLQDGLMFDIAKYALLLTPQNLARICALQLVTGNEVARVSSRKLASLLGIEHLVTNEMPWATIELI